VVCVTNVCLAEWSRICEEKFAEASLSSGAQVVGATLFHERVILSVLSNKSAPSMTVRFRLVKTDEDISGEDLRHVSSLGDINHHLFIDVAPLRAAGMQVGTGHPDDD
jgi:hypothetical protein